MSRSWVEPDAATGDTAGGRADPMIALINVVFLLLIFLMVAGTVAPALSRDVDVDRHQRSGGHHTARRGGDPRRWPSAVRRGRNHGQ
jgi:hypothetical protein